MKVIDLPALRTVGRLRRLCVLVAAAAIPGIAAAGEPAIAMVCSAVDSVGFRWSEETGEWQTAHFEKRSYLLTSAPHDRASCANPEATCVSWRDMRQTKNTVQFPFECFYSNKGDVNERLDCHRGEQVRLVLDLKRGAYVLSENSGPALYGPLAKLAGGDESRGVANDVYVEHGVCNKVTGQ